MHECWVTRPNSCFSVRSFLFDVTHYRMRSRAAEKTQVAETPYLPPRRNRNERPRLSSTAFRMLHSALPDDRKSRFQSMRKDTCSSKEFKPTTATSKEQANSDKDPIREWTNQLDTVAFTMDEMKDLITFSSDEEEFTTPVSNDEDDTKSDTSCDTFYSLPYESNML